MAEVTETNELHTIIILKYKLLIKLYTNEKTHSGDRRSGVYWFSPV